MNALLLALAVQASPLRVAVIGDRTGDPDQAAFEDCVAAVLLMEPDVVVNVGDLIDGYTGDPGETAAQWESVLTVLAPLAAAHPLVLVPGNHDIWDDESRAGWSEATGVPASRVERRGGAAFVVWDTSIPDVLTGADLDSLAVLLAGIDPEEPAVLLTHKPFWMLDGMPAGLVDSLRSMLEDADMEAVIAGHIHTYCSERRDGILYVCSGTSGGDHGADETGQGLFHQVGWLTLETGRAGYAVLEPGGVHPADVNTVSEEQTLYRIESSMLAPRPLEEALESATLSIRAVEDVERTVDISVDPGVWGLRPDTATVTLAPGGGSTLYFSQNPTGSVYPAPVIHTVVHYGDRDKIAEFDTPWPVMRLMEAFEGRVTVDGRADDLEYRGRAETCFADEDGRPASVGPMAVRGSCWEGWFYVHARMDRGGECGGEEAFGLVVAASDALWRLKVFSDGSVAAIRITADGIEDWEDGWQAAVTGDAEGWEVEAGVDLASLGHTGNSFRAHIYRLTESGEATWSWPLDFDEDAMGTVFLRRMVP
jgi:predicted phosphodiesterase